MGIGDFTSTVLTEYKADTKQMRSELKKLSKEQQEQAKKAIEASEKQNDAIERQIATLGKVAIAVGAATAAYKLAESGIEAYQRRSRLAASTSGADLNGLRKATQGLVSETRLLEFASKAMNGTFKLSQTQMEQALQGAVALRKTLGVDLTKALEVTQKAITEGTTEPLKELGLVIKGVENDTREGLMAALGELQNQAKLAGPDLRLPGDEMADSQRQMADAVEDLKISLGKLAQSLAPVIAAMAKLVGYMAQVASISDAIAGVSERDRSTSALQDVERSIKEQEAALMRSMGSSGFESQRALGGMSREEAIAKLISTKRYRNVIAADAARANLTATAGGVWSAITGAAGGIRGMGEPGPGGTMRKPPKGVGAEYILGGAAILEDGLGGVSTGGEMYRSGLYGEAAAFRGRTAEAAQGANAAAEQAMKAAEMFERIRMSAEDNMLASIFGTPAEIDATAMALQQLATGFDGIAGAFGAGVDALITGSESFASAFKRAIGESLRSMSVEMSINAVKHLAYAAASAAFLDGRGAAQHLQAAGMFGAGALAAGVGARLLGAGQAPTARASGGGVSTTGSAGVGSAGPVGPKDTGSTQVFIIGDDFGSLSSRERESRFREISRRAGFTIQGDVVENG